MIRRKHTLKGISLLCVLTLYASNSIAQFPTVLESSGLDGSNGFALIGVAAGDMSGTSVSSAGDINNDGIADLIIGAPNASPNGAASGKSHVLFGGDDVTGGFSALLLSGLDPARGFALDGVAAGDLSGTSVSAAGDVNNDGIDDLIIGAPGASTKGAAAGDSYVLFGAARVNGGFSSVFLSGLDGVKGFAINGVAAGDKTGTSVSAIGDVNNDGIDDLLMGAPTASPSGTDSGISYVLFGGADINSSFSSLFLSGLDSAKGFGLTGVAAGDFSGSTVSAAGDINNDGIDDLILGAPSANPSGAASGKSHVLFGGENIGGGFNFLFLAGLDATLGFALDGVAAGDRSGTSVSSACDINNDGIDDLIIGAPGARPNGAASGKSFVLFGASNVSLGFNSLFLSGLNGTNGFGTNGVSAGDQTGFSVSCAGDINDDGIDDLIIGAPGASPHGAETGSAFVLFGGPNVSGGFTSIFLSGLNGRNGFRINGEQAGDRFGHSVSAAGDVNNDGVDDVIIGAPKADTKGVDSGNSYIIFGRKNLIFSDSFE